VLFTPNHAGPVSDGTAMKRVAIIGTGMAGLTLALQLREQADVHLFEKAAGVGGRMATRRLEGYEFDHGAQFFTARSQAFRRFLQAFLHAGLVQEWKPRVLTLARDAKPYRRDWFEPHYVAVPGMTSLCKAMSAGLNLHLRSEVTALERQASGQWLLELDTGPRPELFDWVIAAVPAPQALKILPAEFAGMDTLKHIRFDPCLVLLLGLQEAPAFRFDAARAKSDILEWIWCNHSRPGRPEKPALVLHSTSGWAASQMQSTDDQIASAMIAELQALSAQVLPPVAVQQIKRWSLAEPAEQEEPLQLLDPALQLATCGDWTHEARIESAFLSATRLATALGRILSS